MFQDQIHIQDLHLRTFIGFNPEEREKKQDVLINITLFTDLSAAGASDSIDDAVNYKTITKRIITHVETNKFDLVEKMAMDIIKLCLQNPQVSQAQVRVEKPGALRFARSVGVSLSRKQGDHLS